MCAVRVLFDGKSEIDKTISRDSSRFDGVAMVYTSGQASLPQPSFHSWRGDEYHREVRRCLTSFLITSKGSLLPRRRGGAVSMSMSMSMSIASEWQS